MGNGFADDRASRWLSFVLAPNPTSANPAGADPVGQASQRFHALVALLRRECPWDRQQTHASLAPHALEEAQELIAAATAQPSPQQQDDLVQELGDLLLQVYMHAAIAEQSGTFALTDVYAAIEQKMTRRHPHVFERAPDEPEMSMEQLAQQWERIKDEERSAKPGHQPGR